LEGGDRGEGDEGNLKRKKITVTKKKQTTEKRERKRRSNRIGGKGKMTDGGP
jgi:hypothetical protein